MSDLLFFNQLVTKSLQPVIGNDRFFEGWLTVEMKDKQGEITVVDELIKVLPIWMDRGAPITDTHSNRVIGKGINYQKTIYKGADGTDYPAIKIVGKIHSDYELDNEIWRRITSGEYKGLSFGGATKSARTPYRMKDGSLAYQLKDLEHYEVAVCKDPAVPLALITDFNPIAKALTDNYTTHSEGKMLIRCTNFGCYIEKKRNVVEDEIINEDAGKVPYSRVAVQSKGEPDEESDLEAITGLKGATISREEAEKLKADLSSYDTFQGKVDALVKEGYPEENAKKIVGAFVKGETKKAELPSLGGKRGIGSDPSAQPEESEQITVKITENTIENYKNTANYINELIKPFYKDMVEETKSKVSSKEEEEDDEDKSEEKEAKKSFREAVKSNFEALTEVMQSIAESQKSNSELLADLSGRVKALETPTDLPIKPKDSDKEDVGAKVTIPDTYQSVSVQAALDADGKDSGKDKGDLKIEKTTTTETPRPSAPVETVNKSLSQDYNLVLKEARETGDLSQVGRNILSGKYYTPSQSEAWY